MQLSKDSEVSPIPFVMVKNKLGSVGVVSNSTVNSRVGRVINYSCVRSSTIEQAILNRLVAGSIPAERTIDQESWQHSGESR